MNAKLPPVDDLILAVWEQAKAQPGNRASCTYDVCIVGRAALSLGCDLSADLLTRSNIIACIYDDNLRMGSYRGLPPGPLRWLQCVQELQDMEETWANAVAAADADSQGQPWLESIKAKETSNERIAETAAAQ